MIQVVGEFPQISFRTSRPVYSKDGLSPTLVAHMGKDTQSIPKIEENEE